MTRDDRPASDATWRHRAPALALAIAVGVAAAVAGSSPAGGVGRAEAGSFAAQPAWSTGAEQWEWPVPPPFRVARPYLAPAHEFGPGHRGIDIEPLGEAVVRAPASGIVAFADDVAGRGILTIDHGGGLVTTLEPVTTDLLPGALVARGDAVGVVALGGHAAPGQVHFGVRLDGEYVNPLLLLGGVPRAVLLPCCD